MAADSPQTLPPSTRVDHIDTAAGRILCVADIRGKISKLNALAAEHNAKAIIHTGDFGFYDRTSVSRSSDRTLKHMVHYSNCLPETVRTQLLTPSLSPQQLRQMIRDQDNNLPNTGPQNGSGATSNFCLSEWPKLLSGEIKLSVPVYTVYGAVEDISILERLRMAISAPLVLAGSSHPSQNASAAANGEPNWSVPNLTILSESCSRVLVIGNLRLRLFGLGGACISHKMFDNGDGQATIAGSNGTMWTTMLQIGELVDTAQRVYDPTETRVLVTHASPGKEGLLAQVALALKVDFTISGSLHFRYGAGYNDYSVLPDTESYRNKFVVAKAAFHEVWDTVKSQVEQVIDEGQRKYLDNALAVTNRIPCEPTGPSGQLGEEPALKNTWNWNLPDWNFGSLVLDIRDGRVSSEMKSQGFNFAYRANAARSPATTSKPQTSLPGAPTHPKAQTSSTAPSAAPTPAPVRSQPSATPSASAPSQPAIPAQSKPNPHRREGSIRDSKGSLPSPGTQEAKLPEKPQLDREKSDRPASRASTGNKRGSQHFKHGSGRTDVSTPDGATSGSSEPQTWTDQGNRGRGRGRGGDFRGGRGRGNRGDFRGGRPGRGENQKEESGGGPGPASAPSPAPKAAE